MRPQEIVVRSATADLKVMHGGFNLEVQHHQR
jgi:hypothetical protein